MENHYFSSICLFLLYSAVCCFSLPANRGNASPMLLTSTNSRNSVTIENNPDSENVHTILNNKTVEIFVPVAVAHDADPKNDKLANPEKPDNPGKPVNSDKPVNPEKPFNQEKPSKSEKPTKLDKPTKADKYNDPNFKVIVTLYPRNNHLGTSTNVTLTSKKRCVNVPGPYLNKILSVDTYGKCAYLYKTKDCEGKKYVQISPGTPSHNRLRDVGLDKKTRSVGVCKNGHNDVYY